jgi:hypothetical protein
MSNNVTFNEAELKAGRGGVHKQLDSDSMDTLKRLGLDLPATELSKSKIGAFVGDALAGISAVTVLKGGVQVVRRYPVVAALSALFVGCAIGRQLYRESKEVRDVTQR